MASLKNKLMLRDLFRVAKRSRPKVSAGKAALRLVINFAATHVCLDAIEGDMPALPTTGQWRCLYFSSDCVLRWSTSDLKCCFYLCSLPKVWWPYMAFNKPLDGSLFGEKGEKVYVCSTVVPMKWASSTEVI
eukprot:6915363-Karenia_brevis.AAC.1